QLKRSPAQPAPEARVIADRQAAAEAAVVDLPATEKVAAQHSLEVSSKLGWHGKTDHHHGRQGSQGTPQEFHAHLVKCSRSFTHAALDPGSTTGRGLHLPQDFWRETAQT